MIQITYEIHDKYTCMNKAQREHLRKQGKLTQQPRSVKPIDLPRAQYRSYANKEARLPEGYTYWYVRGKAEFEIITEAEMVERVKGTSAEFKPMELRNLKSLREEQAA